ncbi:ribosome biogenesis protein SLX9 domain-containing protein [Purpureocillium lavendulum]|uniref:Ribosome biogenesis protein SLX9 n=1 Tax=Purpureocillium lavendulum TaxID=1247861 RepID=A0AB34G1Q9_9HYPO|nr:ribosome biogenesis protein SLX9 domain-containing protein [Purpureocillium lavendulum]
MVRPTPSPMTASNDHLRSIKANRACAAQAPRPPTASEPKPSARALRQARVDGTIHPLLPAKLFRPDAAVSDSFLSSKRDRRTIRRSVFASRVADSASRARGSSASGRVSRRRSAKSKEAKNRLGNLSALASALDDLDDGDDGADGAGEDGDAGEAARAGRIRHRSMKMTKGALKRKERIVRGEMQRFGVSMAKLAETGAGADVASTTVVPPAGMSGIKTTGKKRSKADDVAVGEARQEQPPQPTETGNRWAALRGYISSTMEQNPAFRK